MSDHQYNHDNIVVYDPHVANSGHGPTLSYIPEKAGSNSAYKSSDLGLQYDDATVWDALGNMFTGNLDYKRQVEAAIRAENTSAYEAQKARDFSSKEAAKQRKWQETMSNSAYSRAISDLKKNGINPYLVGSFGAASTPSGGTATAYSGSGYVGSSSSANANGWRILENLATTAYKENSANRRAALNILPSIIRSLLGKS